MVCHWWAFLCWWHLKFHLSNRCKSGNISTNHNYDSWWHIVGMVSEWYNISFCILSQKVSWLTSHIQSWKTETNEIQNRLLRNHRYNANTLWKVCRRTCHVHLASNCVSFWGGHRECKAHQTSPIEWNRAVWLMSEDSSMLLVPEQMQYIDTGRDLFHFAFFV